MAKYGNKNAAGPHSGLGTKVKAFGVKHKNTLVLGAKSAVIGGIAASAPSLSLGGAALGAAYGLGLGAAYYGSKFEKKVNSGRNKAYKRMGL